MGTVTAIIKRKGKAVGRASASYLDDDGPAFKAALKAIDAGAGRQAKADFVARHTGRKSYRKKKAHA